MPLTSPVEFAEVPPFPLDSATIEVLQTGNERQQAAYKCIVSRKFFQILSEMHGVLASTITLGIDTPMSDLDFLCETSGLDRFSVLVKENFRTFDRFNTVLTPTPEISRCYSFWCDGFEIEIFGSLEPLGRPAKPRPTAKADLELLFEFSRWEKILNVSQGIHLRFFPISKIEYQLNLHFLATGRFCRPSLGRSVRI